MSGTAPPALSPSAARGPREPARLPWSARLRDGFSTYLPLLLMALLALLTWGLVKNTPVRDEAAARGPARHQPDYLMQRFTLQRFAPDGRLLAQVEGEQLRHYPDDDTLEIDTVRIHAWSDDGTLTHATARHARANGDASEVELRGGARVQRESGPQGEPVVFEGEYLHAFFNTERITSNLPVLVRQGASEVRAGGLDYDNLSRVAHLAGPTRARFMSPPPAAAARPR